MIAVQQLARSQHTKHAQYVPFTMKPAVAVPHACPVAQRPASTASHPLNCNKLSEALDDLVTRFLNCPAEDISEGEALMLLMFEVEKAHWFYSDFWRERDTSLPSLGIREFALKIFQHTAYLHSYDTRFDTIFTKWQEYKRGVPTFGAIILNSSLTKVLMVQGWSGKSWGWPKGKLNRHESDAVCAAREVYEEIGFDVSPYIDENNAVVAKMGEQHMKLFIIPGIPEDTVFETLTRQEIKDIKWHMISDLESKIGDDLKKNKYYSVVPVLGRLLSWIRDYKRSLSRSRTPLRNSLVATTSATNSPIGPKREKGKWKKGDKGGSYSLTQQETDAAGVARDNADTFGTTFQETASKGFSADEMFRLNAEKFNIHSTYSFDQYTTALPGKKDGATEKGLHAPERFRPCQVKDGLDKDEDPNAVFSTEISEDKVVALKSSGSACSQDSTTHSTLLRFTFDRKAIMDSMGF